MKLSCKECAYCWKEKSDDYSVCHWSSRCPDDVPPCEYDESDYVNEYEDDVERW